MKVTKKFLLQESTDTRVENYYIEPDILNYLINGDSSALENDEIQLADDFAEELIGRSTNFTLDIIGDSRDNFQESDITGMSGECSTVAVHLFDGESNFDPESDELGEDF